MKTSALALGAFVAAVSAQAAEVANADAKQSICPASGPQACACLNWATEAYNKALPEGAEKQTLLACNALPAAAPAAPAAAEAHAHHGKRQILSTIGNGLTSLGNTIGSFFGPSSPPPQQAPQQVPQQSTTTVNGPFGSFITISSPFTVSSPSGSTTVTAPAPVQSSNSNSGGLVNSIFNMLPSTIWGASNNPTLPATSAAPATPATPATPAAPVQPVVQAPKVACGPGQPTCAKGSYCDGQPLCSLDQFCAGVCLPTLSSQLGGKSKMKRAEQEQPLEVRRAVWQNLLDSGEYVLIEAKV